MAQNEPEWYSSPPKPKSNSIIYKTGFGTGFKLEEAKNKAFLDILVKAASQIGISINTQDIIRALQNGSSFEIISSEYEIPINIVCEKSEETRTTFKYYMLAQVPIDTREYSWSYCNCGHQVNRKALACSLFPGLGQIIVKKNKPVGYAFMIGDLALIGGGVYCLLESNNQYDISQNPNYTSNYRQDAYDNYKMLDTSSKILFGAAAVVYVINLYTAYKMPKKTNGFALTPKLIPENNDLAFGVGISYNF